VGECEEDDVLDGATMAGAVEGAACWCRVAHLASGSDAMRECSLVLSRPSHHLVVCLRFKILFAIFVLEPT
jgi:hypothetical protein